MNRANTTIRIINSVMPLAVIALRNYPGKYESARRTVGEASFAGKGVMCEFARCVAMSLCRVMHLRLARASAGRLREVAQCRHAILTA